MKRAVKFFVHARTCALVAAAMVMACATAPAALAKNPKYMSVAELAPAAQAGDAEAQYHLALRYEKGDGVAQNYADAKTWYAAAAAQGQVQAMFEMGMLHAMGRFTQDRPVAAAQSRYWFDQLEAAGVVIEDKFYIWRDNIERKDIADAPSRIEWLRVIAENGHRQAQRYLGYQYDTGKLGARDCVNGAYWYEKAATQGDRRSQDRMGMLSVACAGIPADEAKSAYWFRQAALQGDVGAQISTSAAYRLGKGLPKDDKLAAYWMGQAAEQGSAVAQKELGDFYREGRGVPRDLAMARSWYEKSAAQGYDRGEAALADLRRQTGEAAPSTADTVVMLAALWIALDAVSDITSDDPEPSPHSPFVQKAINQCRNDVHRRMVRCYSSMTIPGCTMTGQCTYEWTCQTGNKGRGKCSPNARYTDEQVDYYCDPLVGDKYTTRDAVYASSCH